MFVFACGNADRKIQLEEHGLSVKLLTLEYACDVTAHEIHCGTYLYHRVKRPWLHVQSYHRDKQNRGPPSNL